MLFNEAPLESPGESTAGTVERLHRRKDQDVRYPVKGIASRPGRDSLTVGSDLTRPSVFVRAILTRSGTSPTPPSSTGALSNWGVGYTSGSMRRARKLPVRRETTVRKVNQRRFGSTSDATNPDELTTGHFVVSLEPIVAAVAW